MILFSLFNKAAGLEIDQGKEELEEIKPEEKTKQKESKKIQLCKHIEEGEIDDKAMNEIFNQMSKSPSNLNIFTTISKENVFPLNRYERGTLLDLKSDYLYNDPKFQKQHFDKYFKIVRDLCVKIILLKLF